MAFTGKQIISVVCSILFLPLLFAPTLLGQTLVKQPPPLNRILFIFDASYSMNSTWESDKRINIARSVLISMVDSLEKRENMELALRVYGHQSPVPPQDCSDSKLEVPFAKNNGARIRQRLRFIEPKGTTPLANSLLLAAKDFPPCADCRNIVILITDGIEACDGDPCEVSIELQKQGITLKPFVIGVGMDEGFAKTFDCIGTYFSANNESNFREALKVVIEYALSSTTAQVNLLDKSSRPTETNVPMTFFDAFSGKLKHGYIHTMNHRGLPDTLMLDPMVTYKLVVHTIPPVQRDSFKLVPGKHSVIALDAPQGTLVVRTEDGIQYRDLGFIVRKGGFMETLNMQKMNLPEKYIVGKYDIEIPVLPRINLNGIEVKQSETTTITIPRPGIATFMLPTEGFGSVFLMQGNKQPEWVCNLSPNTRNEVFQLQPGSYMVVYRSRNTRQTIYSTVKYFDVNPGSSIAIRF
jgi:Ca-activated chloride channel homolog